MDGFAQGLLAGFSTVDNAMQQRKALGLRADESPNDFYQNH